MQPIEPATETISAATAAQRLERSKRYTLTLIKAGRVKGVTRFTGGDNNYVITVPVGQAPEIDPPLKKRHKP